MRAHATWHMRSDVLCRYVKTHRPRTHTQPFGRLGSRSCPFKPCACNVWHLNLMWDHVTQAKVQAVKKKLQKRGNGRVRTEGV